MCIRDRLRDEFGRTFNLPAIFIDTYYKKESQNELDKFQFYTKKLWNFARTRTPFECKDIKIALTDIRFLENAVESLISLSKESNQTIQKLQTTNNEMNQTLKRNGIQVDQLGIKLATLRSSKEELREKLSTRESLIQAYKNDRSTRHTHMEFALFGIGMCFIGMIVSLAVMWNVRRNPKEEKREYEEDDMDESEENIFSR